MSDWQPAARAELAAKLTTLEYSEATELIRSLQARPPASRPASPASARPSARVRAVVRDRDRAAGGVARAALHVPIDADEEPSVGGSEPARLASLDHVPVVAALRALVRVEVVLDDITAILDRGLSPQGLAELTAAVRAVRGLDWGLVQHRLGAVERLLDAAALRPDPGGDDHGP